MRDVAIELWMGLRALRRSPGLAVTAVVLLGLGIGANTAIFSALRAALVAPLPYADADRLVQVWNRYPFMGLQKSSVSIPDYLDRREQVPAFEGTALYGFRGFNVSLDEVPERVIGVRATASLFPLLGVEPLLGRTFGEEDQLPGSDRVVVLGYGLWMRSSGGDPGVVGKDVRLDGLPHRVLGVMPEGFAFPEERISLWKPFAFTLEMRSDASRGSAFSHMVARLAPGATIDAAQRQVDAVHERNKERFPEHRASWESSGFGGLVVSYRDEITAELRPALFLLQAAVGLVLAIACANVANLLATRLHGRRQELALRTLLGAGRGRLARQLFAETSWIAIGGGLLGLGIAQAGIGGLARIGVVPPPVGDNLGLDVSVLAFTTALCLLATLVFTSIAFLTLSRADAHGALKASGPTASPGSVTTRRLFVVAEVALALLLLVGSGLLLRSFVALSREDPGFNEEDVLAGRVTLPRTTYGDDERAVGFFEEALLRIRSLPGVSAASVASQVPFSGSAASGSYRIEGYVAGPGEPEPHAFIRSIDADYFRTMEIPVLLGRSFDARDRAGAEPVVIVDEALVAKYWPNESPLGQRIGRGTGGFWRVVGVVGRVKTKSLEEPASQETIYLPLQQSPVAGMYFLVRTAEDAALATSAVRGTVLSVDPELPVYNVATLGQQMDAALSTRRVSAALVASFGTLGLLLAAVGLYAVVSFSFVQRARELSIRCALGAGGADILKLVLSEGLGLTAAGVVLGVGLALVLGRFLSPMLFGVSANDPLTFLGAAAVLFACAFAACWPPAIRARRVDPVLAMKA